MLEAPIAAIDSIVQSEEVVQLLEAAEVAGSVRSIDLLEVLEPHGLDAIEVDAVYRMFEERGIDVVEESGREREPAPPPRRRPSNRPRTRCSCSSARPVDIRF